MLDRQLLRALFSLIPLLPAASCIAFGGPAPTDVGPDKALNGFTPKPTHGPSISELQKRQRSFGVNTCGWIDRDYCNSTDR
ncbi:uncharacterized protein EI97DRAFT_435639 [Westerdykella ornata]|uniref:Lipoprotein n=1 Tax=Westerdykella ornata TaxID=318751 RepID=A0A6A6JC30_WESOR|nr:uncharacterized protein EI97DRAFT_435639 [Westerdykella ornata]KAF2273992.1 hypothetical protein EI97DRAFT_435639 [Westerdykella ornata]